MKKIVTTSLALLLLTGCGLFKTERRDIPPPEPKLNAKQDEKLREQAQVNYELAERIRQHGTSANSEESITLSDGTQVFVRFMGIPYRTVSSENLKEVRNIIEDANDVVNDHNKDLAKHDDKMDDFREKVIRQTNLKWDWGRIFGSTIFLVVFGCVGVPVLMAFFPVIIPVVSLVFQALRMGVGALGTLASFGISGMVSTIKAVEKFREAHKGTDIGKAFDAHMTATLDDKHQVTLDALKNKLNI